MPESSGLRSSANTAGPPYAPSTWNHTSRSAQTSAISSSGSIAPVETVPALATTATGRTPAATSCSIAARSAGTDIRYASSASMVRTASVPSPSMSAARRVVSCTSEVA
jgi:hypothetical protein